MEDNSYDPLTNVLLDDTDKAYEPACLAPEHLEYEDSLSDELSDDGCVSPQSPSTTGPFELQSTASVRVDYVPTPRSPTTPAPSFVNAHESEDQEYRLESFSNVNTPAYAPSQTFGSPSESPISSDLSAGYLSPTSTIGPSMTAKEDSESIYSKRAKLDNYGSPHGTPDHTDIEAPHPDFIIASPKRSADVSHIMSTVIPTVDFGDEDDEADNKLNEDFEGFEQDEQPESQVDGIIADIFGESDAEEEFEGFAENEVEKEIELDNIPSQTEAEVEPPVEAPDSDQEQVEEGEGDDGEFVSDFDKIMARKREEMKRRRRRQTDIEFLNDSDDMIIATITRMKQAAEEDRHLVAQNKPATKKLKMVSKVSALLRRADLKAALVENGMLSAITDWLAPMPGHTLPNLVIRDSMLICLREFQSLSTEVLQDSGIGKALMYLYKHPRETRENKDKAGRLINEWLRPIFNLTSDYRTLSKEERKQLDYEHLPKRRNIDNENYAHRDINRELDGETQGLLRPGDPGWVGRARVPQPSNKDYIIRPKWKVSDRPDNDEDEDGEMADEQPAVFRRRRKVGAPGTLGAGSRIENHIRNLTQTARQKHAKMARAVTMSIEGRKMSL